VSSCVVSCRRLSCCRKKGRQLGWRLDSIQVLTMKGKVYLMDAGSGESDLLNGRAVRVLRAAEVVLHDELVSPEILELLPASAQVRNVDRLGLHASSLQERIHSLLISAARDGHNVVLLKSNGTAAQSNQETEALTQAGIDFEVISGAESAMGATAGANTR
jgi:siroheme synthase